MAEAAERWTDAIDRVLETRTTRVVLTLLIFFSLLPLAFVEHLNLMFLLFFLTEFLARLVVFSWRMYKGRLSLASATWDVAVLCLDFMAMLSFVPRLLDFDSKSLKLLRVMRLGLLVAYWAPVFEEAGIILLRRERRGQLLFVVASVGFLTVVVGFMLYHMGVDHRVDGEAGFGQHDFWGAIWWSFRQVEDPGNLVASADTKLVMATSLVLTACGLFLFSFLIGIGTSVVNELVARASERAVGMHDHTIVVNVWPRVNTLISELLDYKRKHRRKPRFCIVDRRPDRPDWLAEAQYRDVAFRHGNAYDARTLAKADVASARRVVLMADHDRDDPDAETVSTALIVREANREAWIVAEVTEDQDIHASQVAAGVGTHVTSVPTERLIALFLTAVIRFPGIESVLRHLLTASKFEIYTGIYERGLLGNVRSPFADGPVRYDHLFERAFFAHDMVLVGVVAEPGGEKSDLLQITQPKRRAFHVRPPTRSVRLGHRAPKRRLIINPDGAPGLRVDEVVSGFIAVAHSFDRVHDFMKETVDRPRDAATPLYRAQASQQLVDSFGLMHTATDHPQRVLIHGFRPGLVHTIEHLFRYYPGVRIDWIVHEAAVPGVVTRLRRWGGEAHREGSRDGFDHGRFKPAEEGEHCRCFRFQKPGSEEEASGALTIVAGNWSAILDVFSVRRGGQRQPPPNVLALTLPWQGRGDRDSTNLLALIQVLDAYKLHRKRFPKDFRVVIEVEEPEKTKTIARLAEAARVDAGRRLVTAVPAEEIRSLIMAQAAMIPEFVPLYTELLGEWGEEICRIVPSTELAKRAVTFRELLFAFQRVHCVLIAVETRERDRPENTRTIVCGEKPFLLNTIEALYLIGDTERLTGTSA